MPHLLLVAHGTASATGSRTTAALVDAIAAARPDVPVRLCFLDVASPRLPEALAGLDGPTVVVPLLLSTGYHVQSDIPAAVAAHPQVRVARHLGPHPLLVDALVDRLGATTAAGVDTVATAATAVALVGAGSTRPEARDELDETARLLAGRLARPVTVLTVGPDLVTRLAAVPRPLAVATYLLAGGQFVDSVRAAAGGIATVAEPLGTHPKLVELVWTRYDEAVQQVR